MAVATIRRENESSEKLISRWNKKSQAARTAKTFKDRRYYDGKKKNPNKTKTKDSALKREHYRAIRRKMQYY